MPNYQRNQDDSYSDPELIAAHYLVGKSPYYEVQLVLDEYEQTSSNHSNAGSPALISALGERIGTIRVGCPSVEDYIWVERYGEPKAIPVGVFAAQWKREQVYNPIHGDFNDVDNAEIFETDLYIITSRRLRKARASRTHALIRNTGDEKGLSASRFSLDQELLTFTSPEFIYLDQFKEMALIGPGRALELSLKNGYIYVSGMHPDGGIVAHNLKREEI